jgi:L,D-peptidoglycan transpeptidase YkuD (ErfK/YbiS/YcfS/YnhG family)
MRAHSLQALALVCVLLAGPARADTASDAPAAPAAPTSASAAAGTGDAISGQVAASIAPVAAVAAAVTPASGEFTLADRVVVSKSARRLYLMQRERVIAEYPIRLGLNPVGHKEREGDFRTPEGSYQLTRRNERSDFFLSIGVSYPNPSDIARARRQRVAPGGAIMIHGEPNLPRKPPEYYARNDWTDGCIAVSNSDMVDIWLRTRIGLPIEIRP